MWLSVELSTIHWIYEPHPVHSVAIRQSTIHFPSTLSPSVIPAKSIATFRAARTKRTSEGFVGSIPFHPRVQSDAHLLSVQIYWPISLYGRPKARRISLIWISTRVLFIE